MSAEGLQFLGLFAVVFVAICAIGVNEIKLRTKKRRAVNKEVGGVVKSLLIKSLLSPGERSPYEQLEKLTVKELRKLARDHKVRKYWLKRKSQLIEDIRNSGDLDA
jgi:hypothetical protein